MIPLSPGTPWMVCFYCLFFLLILNLDCVGLASAGCSVGEEQLVLSLQEILHLWCYYLTKHSGLSAGRLKNLGEGIPTTGVDIS